MNTATNIDPPEELIKHSTITVNFDSLNVDEGERECENITTSLIYRFKNDDRPHIDIKIQGRTYRAMIDSGSQTTVISREWIENKEDWGKPLDTVMRLTTVDGTMHEDCEMILVKFEFQHTVVEVPTTIMDRPMKKIIVGTDFMKKFGIELSIRTGAGEACESAEVCYVEGCGEQEQWGKELERAISKANTPHHQEKFYIQKKCHEIETNEGKTHPFRCKWNTTEVHKNPKIESIAKPDQLTAKERRKMSRLIEQFKKCCEIRSNEEAIYTFTSTAKANEDFERPKIENVTKPYELTLGESERLAKVLDRFTYTTDTGVLNVTSKIKHHIDTGEAEPIIKRQYPHSPYQQAELKKVAEQQEKQGIIKKITHSNWRSPILPVPKPDGSVRMCLDARALNKVTIVNTYPMPDVNLILAQLRKSRYITSIDLSQAFFQVALDEESQLKTAFAVGNQLYCYQRMTMGLRNSPATLASLIESIFKNLEPRAFAYCDDFIICTETFDEHMELLTEVAKRLNEANLTISRTKSHFVCKQLKFLGYILSEQGLSIDPERIKAIRNYKQPVTVKQVRSFIGAVGWVSRFIIKFAEKSAPLIDLIKGAKTKNAKITWNDRAETAFQSLKDGMINPPILIMCDYNKAFKLYTDASDIAGAGVLMQEIDGENRPIFYYSFKFNPAEQNYSTSERECLAIIRSLEKFSCYVKGCPLPVQVYTDHAALNWMMSLKDQKGRLLRWSIRAQEFNFQINVVRGKDNELADVLSREIDHEILSEEEINKADKSKVIEEIEVNQPHAEINLIQPEKETSDKWYLRTHEQAKQKSTDEYKIENNELYYKRPATIYNSERTWVICIPREARLNVLREEHDDRSHPGMYKTIDRIKKLYYWPGIYDSVYKYVRSCQICRLNKPSNENRRSKTGEYRDPKQIGRLLSIDFIGPVPRSQSQCAYIFVVIDCYSKYLFVKPMRSQTTEGAIDFLTEDVFRQNGAPEKIISDNGTPFISKAFKEMCAKYKIKHILTPVRHPKANPVESSNKNIKIALRTYLHQQKDHSPWQKNIKKVVSDLNSATHTTTGVSPYYLQYGRELVYSGDEYRNLIDVDRNNEGSNINDEETTINENNDTQAGRNKDQTQNIDNSSPLVESEEQIRSRLINEDIRVSNHKAFKKNERNENLRAKTRKFQINQQIWIDNIVQSKKAEKTSSKLSAPKKIGIIKEKLGNDTYLIVGMDGKTIGKWHADNISTR